MELYILICEHQWRTSSICWSQRLLSEKRKIYLHQKKRKCRYERMDKRMTQSMSWISGKIKHFFIFSSRLLDQNHIGNIYDDLFLFIVLVIISSVQKRAIYGIEPRTTNWHLPVSCCQAPKAARSINKSYTFNIGEVFFFFLVTLLRSSSCLPSPLPHSVIQNSTS